MKSQYLFRKKSKYPKRACIEVATFTTIQEDFIYIIWQSEEI